MTWIKNLSIGQLVALALAGAVLLIFAAWLLGTDSVGHFLDRFVPVKG